MVRSIFILCAVAGGVFTGLTAANAATSAVPATAQNASVTPRLENFRLQDCSNADCLSAVGESAFVAQGRPALSAVHVALEIHLHNLPSVRVICDSFRYDVVTRLLVCDNRDAHSESLTIDHRFVVTKYP